MKSSSPKAPCPSCSRTKGNYCRWDDSRVFCYQGNTHHPPRNLKKGETLVQADGIKYFFAGYDKGYSGNSALFCLHDPKNDRFDRPYTIREKRRLIAQDLDDLEKLREEFAVAQQVVSHALAAPNYEFLTPDEIRGWMTVIADAFQRLIQIKPKVMRLRHLDDGLREVFKSITEQLRCLSYQKKDFEMFWFDTLCDPSGGRGKRMAEQLQLLQLEILDDPDFTPEF